jgi:UDP-GlcNAc:undecaprenyl-phosphate GlcNAc-1-phosphate transferase
MSPALLIAVITGFLAAVALVPVSRGASSRLGLVAHPVADRWHRRSVGKLGGVAMALAFALAVTLTGTAAQLWTLLLPAALMFGIGLVDDVRSVRPMTKLVGQILVVALLMYLAPPITLTGHLIADYMLAFLWVIGLTNALNLLDNIDGLAAGIAAIAAAFLTATFVMNGAPALVPLALALGAFVGVALGFLVYNFQPASIFMGDSGSHLLGFVISAGTLLAVPHLSPTALVPAAVTPVVILLIPIFDTAFVTITRGLSGRSIFSGGRDHTSHRLVALGIGERRAVIVLYALALLGGLVGISFQGDASRYSWALAALYAGVLVSLGIFLGHVDATHPEDGAVPATPLPTELTNRYRFVEVAIDALLIGIAYYVAFGIRFQDAKDFSHFLPYFAQSLPLVLGLQLAGLTLAGKYRQVWRSFDAAEVRALLQGVIIGVGATVIAVLYLYSFIGFSRKVFLYDAALLPVLVISARAALSAADDYLRRKRAGGRTALIIGAGHGGALAVRELLQNPEHRCVPIGFLDDDPAKLRRRVDGFRVLGPLSALGPLLDAQSTPVAIVIVTVRHLDPHTFAAICEACDARGIDVRQMRFSLEDTDWRDRTPGVVKFPGR